jgi:tetratricopeptide (TPR) repeat protein
MKVLTPLILSLKPGEVQLVRYYYKMQITNEVVKRHLLFDLIKNRQVKSDEEACKIIYNKKPNAAYSQLKKRLKTDILNILLLQDSKSRFNTPFARAEFDARRMIIEGDILISRGISKEGVKILEKAAEIAVEYELFNEYSLANDILLSHLSYKNGVKEYEKYHGKIKNSLSSLEKFLKSKDYYHKILVPNIFNLNKETELIAFCKQAMKELKSDYETTSSSRIGYYYYYVSIFYFNMIKDYRNAYAAAQNFLKIIVEHKPIQSKRNVADAYLQIGYIALQLGDYKSAIKNTENALKNFKTGLINELTTLEVLFLSCYYDSDWKKSHDILNRALNHPKLHSNQFLPAKWNYYKTCLLFKEKKFAEATHALNDCAELLNDRTGWLYGYKMMDILLAFENGTEFLIDNKVANYRKILRKQNGVSIERPKVILKILETLIRKRYNFKEVAKAQKQLLELLLDKNTHYTWEPMGHELIPFNEWFESKMIKRVASKQ